MGKKHVHVVFTFMQGIFWFYYCTVLWVALDFTSASREDGNWFAILSKSHLSVHHPLTDAEAVVWTKMNKP